MAKKSKESLDQATIAEFCQYLEQLIPKARQLAVDAGKSEADNEGHDSCEDAMLYLFQCDQFKNKIKAAKKEINKKISLGSKALDVADNVPVVTRNFSDAIDTAMQIDYGSEVRCETFMTLIHTLLYSDPSIVRSFSRALGLIFDLYEITSEEECAKRKCWSRATRQRIATHSQ